MERLPAVLALGDLASLPLAEGIAFRPIRRPLGVSAFGINATVDAPAGTLVFARPEQRRGAVAKAPGTTVLVIGGKPGAAGPPSPFEFWYSAIGKPPEEAYAIAAEGLEHYPDNPGLHYDLACHAALAGRREDALGHLRQAFAGRPELRERALEDEDLVSLRADVQDDLA